MKPTPAIAIVDAAIAVYPKNVFARVNGNGLRNYTERWKNHYVYNRVRIEPEEVLEQDRITTKRWIKNTNTKHALKDEQEECYCNHWCSKKLDQ